MPLKLINLVWREQGLMVAQGNLKNNIRALEDLVQASRKNWAYQAEDKLSLRRVDFR